MNAYPTNKNVFIKLLRLMADYASSCLCSFKDKHT